MNESFNLPTLPAAPEVLGVGLEARRSLVLYFIDVLRLNQPIDTTKYKQLEDQVCSEILAHWDIVKTDAQKRQLVEIVHEAAMEVLTEPREVKLLQLGNVNPGYRKSR